MSFMKAVGAVAACVFTWNVNSTQLSLLPPIEGLKISSEASEKIKAGTSNWIHGKRIGAEDNIVVDFNRLLHQGEYLDENCLQLIDYYTSIGQPIPNHKNIVGQSNVNTNQLNFYKDSIDVKEISAISQVDFKNSTLAIQVDTYKAYGIYQGPLLNKIEEVEYQGNTVGQNILLHTFTMGFLMIRPIDRQQSLGCKTKKISERYIDSNNSKFTGAYALFKENKSHDIAIEGFLDLNNMVTDSKGLFEIKMDDDMLLRLPSEGIIKLKLTCKTCIRNSFFGASEDFPGHSIMDFNYSNDRRMANRRKINQLFKANLTDTGFARLDLYNSLEFNVAEERYKKMIVENLGYAISVTGYLEYLQDELDANNSGKTIKNQREARLLKVEQDRKKLAESAKKEKEIRENPRTVTQAQINAEKNEWQNRCRNYARALNECAVASSISRCMKIKVGELDFEMGKIYCKNGQPDWWLMGNSYIK